MTMEALPDAATLSTFIEDVAPHVRELVAVQQASSPVAAAAPERGG